MTDWQRGTDSAVAASLALLQEAAQTLEHPPALSSPYCRMDAGPQVQGILQYPPVCLAQTHPHSEKL